MQQRQETSVRTSIQDLLRDEQGRVAQARTEAERRAREDDARRLDDIRRQDELQQARLQADEDERQRRAFEAQKRQTELQAVQEATMHRARLEAESQARLAELSLRQEHERQLHALRDDKSKKLLKIGLVMAGAFLFALAGGGGVWLTKTIEDARMARAEAREMEVEKLRFEADKSRLEDAIRKTTDKNTVEIFQQQLDEANSRLNPLKEEPRAKKRALSGSVPPVKASSAAPTAAGSCPRGDPMCPDIPP
jgi:hypothetical protein